MGAWVGGWLEKVKIEQSSASAGLKLAELGKKHMNSLTEGQNVFFLFVGPLGTIFRVGVCFKIMFWIY